MTSTGGGAPWPAPETRDWAALPSDILSEVFLRLGSREVMLGAEFACTAWRRVALDEPALWRSVGMGVEDHRWRRRYVNKEHEMNLAAVDRAAGLCEAFTGMFYADDLLDLAERAPSLKTLNLTNYTYYEEDSVEELIGVLKKFPLLEDLQIGQHSLIFDEKNLLGYVCQACPRLRKLVVMYSSEEEYKEEIGGGISLMPELHSLELHDCHLSFEGLHNILDNCPLLETLYVDGYFKKGEMDKDLHLKCARVTNLTLPSSAA